jgi:hypothetical protein
LIAPSSFFWNKEPFRDEVDGEHALDAMVLRDLHAHLPDRPEAVDRERAAFRRVGVRHGLPRRRQHVGEEEEALVGKCRCPGP